jgi:hypothetical protein
MSDYQRYLLDKYYRDIKNLIKIKVRRMYPQERWSRLQDYISIAKGSIFFEASTFDINKSKENHFASYVAKMCIYRLLDHLRKNNKRFVKIDDNSLNKCRIYNIEEDGTVVNIHSGGKRFMLSSNHKDFDEIDWEDFKINMIRNSRVFFSGEKQVDQIYQDIVINYLIPLSETNEHPTLSQIGSKYNVNEPYMSHLLNSEKMKTFIARCYGNHNEKIKRLAV